MKRTSFEIKKKILYYIKESSLSLAQLERKVNTNYITIKNSCNELEEYGFIEIKKIEKHPSNGKPFYYISLTNKGRQIIDKNKKEKN